MNSLVWRSGARFLIRHPWQLLLALSGIMLGVAVVVSIDLAKASALSSFERATLALFGRATHRISAPAGVDETVYRKLRRSGFVRIRPMLEGIVETVTDHRRLKLIGVDPLVEIGFAPAWLEGVVKDSADSMRRLLLEPGAVGMSRVTGERLGLHPGQEFVVLSGNRRVHLHLVGWFGARAGSAHPGLDDMLIADVATVQEALNAIGHLSAIDVIASGPAEIRDLKSLLPPGAELVTREAGSVSVRHMTDAFYTSLAALSLLSLLVGAFLIYNTVSFMTVQRRRLYGILRMLGSTRREIRCWVLLEAACLGMVGSALGLMIGCLLGRFMLALLARSLNEIYFPLPTAELTLSFWSLAKGAGLGLAATTVAAWKPAVEASGVNPATVLARSGQELRVRARIWLAALAGLVFLGMGAALIAFSTGLVSGFVALTLAVLGCALWMPLATWFVMGLLQCVGGLLFGPLGRMPARAVTASLSRTGVAAAALMVAIATTVGMGLMIYGFRNSVANWLERRLDADLYVYAPARVDGHATLPRKLGYRIAALPGVAAVGSVRYLRQVTERGFIRINAYDLSPSAFATFDLVQKAVEHSWEAFQSRGWVMVSQAYAHLHGVHAGDRITLPTALGPRKFPVGAVYVDYNAGRGIVAMSRNTYDRFWKDAGVSTFWVYLVPDADPVQMGHALRSLAPDGGLEITDNRSLLRLSLGIFDQAFAVTSVLRWLATAVAFIGVFSALLALQLERAREFGVLRALGLTPGQLWLQVMTETGLLGLVAGLSALPVGILTGWFLMEVINHRAFGWTLTLEPEPGILLLAPVVALAAAFPAGLYPAWRMARAHPASALRCE